MPKKKKKKYVLLAGDEDWMHGKKLPKSQQGGREMTPEEVERSVKGAKKPHGLRIVEE